MKAVLAVALIIAALFFIAYIYTVTLGVIQRRRADLPEDLRHTSRREIRAHYRVERETKRERQRHAYELQRQRELFDNITHETRRKI